jgi:hypothetical protein
MDGPEAAARLALLVPGLRGARQTCGYREVEDAVRQVITAATCTFCVDPER